MLDLLIDGQMTLMQRCRHPKAKLRDMASSTKLKDRTQSIKMYEFTQWKAYASCMCTGYQLIDHSMHVRQQDAELTSTNTHHNAQKNQKKLLALCVACHHTAKTYKLKYKLVLCQHRVYATPTHFTRIDGKATPLFTHLTYSSPDTRASSSTFTQPPFFLLPFSKTIALQFRSADWCWESWNANANGRHTGLKLIRKLCKL